MHSSQVIWLRSGAAETAAASRVIISSFMVQGGLAGQMWGEHL